jgi:two-component system, repressor protein LuxO
MTRPARLLLVEDNPTLQLVYRTVLERAGHRVTCAATGAEAVAALRTGRADAVLIDLVLPDRDGLEVMQELRTFDPELPVVVITANGSIPRAVDAMRAGAQDFLVKPFSEQKLLQTVTNAVRMAPQAASDEPPKLPEGFIGSSSPMQAVFSRILSVSRSMAPVFITGESGTGKTLCAEAVHRASPRAGGPFVTVNCAGQSADALTSALFGHLKGAVPGAVSDRKGAIAAADGGTLFLNGVCDIDRSVQAKLECFLQTGTIEPLGASAVQKADVRVVCACDRDPVEAVRNGTLRPDLFYRLHVIAIHMPPLRDRGADILGIARGLLDRIARDEGRRFSGIEPAAAEVLERQPWPGNVRQLVNVLRNIAVLHDGPTVTRDMLPADLLRDAGVDAHGVGTLIAPRTVTLSIDEAVSALSGLTLAQVERLLIEAGIDRLGGSVPRAALMLGVSPSTLYRKIASWNAEGAEAAGAI